MARSWIDEARKAREIESVPKCGVINPASDPRNFIEEAKDKLEWSIEKGELLFCKWSEIDEFIRIALRGLRDSGHRDVV
jgi:hypothetical protein